MSRRTARPFRRGGQTHVLSAIRVCRQVITMRFGSPTCTQIAWRRPKRSCFVRRVRLSARRILTAKFKESWVGRILAQAGRGRPNCAIVARLKKSLRQATLKAGLQSREPFERLMPMARFILLYTSGSCRNPKIPLRQSQFGRSVLSRIPRMAPPRASGRRTKASSVSSGYSASSVRSGLRRFWRCSTTDSPAP